MEPRLLSDYLVRNARSPWSVQPSQPRYGYQPMPTESVAPEQTNRPIIPAVPKPSLDSLLQRLLALKTQQSIYPGIRTPFTSPSSNTPDYNYRYQPIDTGRTPFPNIGPTNNYNNWA